MKAELKEKWLKALRSGEYHQGKNKLHCAVSNTYCCVGVLCVAAGFEFSENSQGIFVDPITHIQTGFGALLSARQLVDISWTEHDKLVNMNDHQGKNFLEIADWIEKNIGERPKDYGDDPCGE